MQITICVKNTGDCRGKEVVQVYVQAPQGKLGKPARELKAFAKTKELAPGEKQKMTLHIPVKNLASYDDSGVAGHKSCYVSEAGAYVFHVGNSVRNTKIADVDGKGAYIVKELCVTEALQEALAPTEAFERIRPGQSREDGSYQQEKEAVPQQTIRLQERIEAHLPEQLAITGDKGIRFSDVAEGKADLDTFIAAIDQRGTCHDRARGRNEQPESNTGYGIHIWRCQRPPVCIWNPGCLLCRRTFRYPYGERIEGNTASNRNTACMFV